MHTLTNGYYPSILILRIDGVVAIMFLQRSVTRRNKQRTIFLLSLTFQRLKHVPTTNASESIVHQFSWHVDVNAVRAIIHMHILISR